MVTSQERLQLDKPSPQSTFGLDEVVYVVVYVTWPDITKGGGEHPVEWNWYRGDQLVSHAHAMVRFMSAPADLHTGRPASALGVGSYKVDTVLDGKVISTNAFTIKA